jgi:hypothetical protein
MRGDSARRHTAASLSRGGSRFELRQKLFGGAEIDYPPSLCPCTLWLAAYLIHPRAATNRACDRYEADHVERTERRLSSSCRRLPSFHR